MNREQTEKTPSRVQPTLSGDASPPVRARNTLNVLLVVIIVVIVVSLALVVVVWIQWQLQPCPAFGCSNPGHEIGFVLLGPSNQTVEGHVVWLDTMAFGAPTNGQISLSQISLELQNSTGTQEPLAVPGCTSGPLTSCPGPSTFGEDSWYAVLTAGSSTILSAWGSSPSEGGSVGEWSDGSMLLNSMTLDQARLMVVTNGPWEVDTGMTLTVHGTNGANVFGESPL